MPASRDLGRVPDVLRTVLGERRTKMVLSIADELEQGAAPPPAPKPRKPRTQSCCNGPPHGPRECPLRATPSERGYAGWPAGNAEADDAQ